MFKLLIRRYSRKKIILLVADISVLVINTLFILSISSSEPKISIENILYSTEKLILFLFVDLAAPVIFRYLNLYKEKIYFNISRQFILIVKSITLLAILIIVVTFLIKNQSLNYDSRLHLLLFITLNTAIILLSRVIIIRIYKRSLHRQEIFRRKILAIGAGIVGKRFLNNIKSNNNIFIDIVGFIDDDKNKLGTEIDGTKVLGDTKELVRIVKEHNIEEIFITMQSVSYDRILELIKLSKEAGCLVNLISSHYKIISNKYDTAEYQNIISVPIYFNLSPAYLRYVKRLLDIIVGAISIMVLSPILFIIAIIVKLTSRGPVFYKTSVIGKDGIEFQWYKFRSMYANDGQIHKAYLKEIIQHNKYVVKINNDSRITPFGKFIRKYSLDELPQLFNVIKGDMSLVGPRPCLPYEFEQMNNWQRSRIKVLPGITGLWQIIGRNRQDVNFNDSIIMDLYYADNISLWFDLKILLKTIPVVLLGKGGL